MGMTPAEKQRAYRQRQAAAAAHTVTLPRADYDALSAAVAQLHQAVSEAASKGSDLARDCVKATPAGTVAALAAWFTTATTDPAVTLPATPPPAPADVDIMAAMLIPSPKTGGLYEFIWASEYAVPGVHSLDEYLRHLRGLDYQGTAAPELYGKCQRRYGDPARNADGVPIRTKRKDGGEGLVIAWLPKKKRGR